MRQQPKANRRMAFGEPYAGKPHVRFDEGRRWEDETDNYGRLKPVHTTPPTLLGNGKGKRRYMVEKVAGFFECGVGSAEWRKCQKALQI